MLPVIAGTMIATGLYGALTQKRPKANSANMDEVFRLISEQYKNVDTYFNEANTAFESQYKGYYGQSMQDAVNEIAGSGIYESPVSENILNRKRTALGETYATGKSQLAGQRLSAMGDIDRQKIAYYQNLSDLQYQRQLMKQQARNNMFSTIGSLGTALAGV